MATLSGVDSLPVHECWDYLRMSQVGRLAVIVDGQPDIFPINFVVDHGTVVFRTAEGSKLSAITSGKQVAFEVDGVAAETGAAWSVIIKGDAAIVREQYELLEATLLPLYPWDTSPKRHFVRINPQLVTGRRFHIVDPGRWGVPSRVNRASPE